MCSSLIYYNLVARWTLEVNEAIGVLLYIISLSLNICDNTYYCITIKMMTSFESYIHSLPCGLPLWNKKGVFVVIGSRLPFYPPSQRLPSLFLLPDDNPTTAGVRTTFGFRFGDLVLHRQVSRPPMVHDETSNNNPQKNNDNKSKTQNFHWYTVPIKGKRTRLFPTETCVALSIYELHDKM